MKFFRHVLLVIVLLTGLAAQAQLINNISALSPGSDFSQKNHGAFRSKLSVSIAAGLSNYLGDLREHANLFRESSFALSAGLSYRVFPHLHARVDLSVMKLQASDSKNSRIDLNQRNLSFKSAVWDLALSAEYDIRNLDNHKFTPYLFAGVGAFYFNPYTIDRFGNKIFLQPLGTEGQGLALYPERKYYKRVALEVPLGGGIKWAVSKKLTLGLEFKYRHTNTDYIDDVSLLGYPNKAALDARDPGTALLTWRGDEYNGVPYPVFSPGTNRGSPNKSWGANDAFYTTQFKLIFKL